MRERKINLKEKPLDLEKTLECGQTFSWNKEDSEESKYYTVRNDGVLKVWQKNEKLFYENLGRKIDPKELLRLDDPLEEIYQEISKNEFIQKTITYSRGLRIVNDKFFPCLIAYISSSQMQINRIKRIQRTITEKYGKKLKFNETYHQFPAPKVLSKVSERELRDLGLGYRSKYIIKTSEMLTREEVLEGKLKEKSYEEAKKILKKLPGVGNKVADCVLLFSLGFLEAFPIDTWMRKIAKAKYPELYARNYQKMSEKMRNYFGKYAGYAQEYLFHYGRSCSEII